MIALQDIYRVICDRCKFTVTVGVERNYSPFPELTQNNDWLELDREYDKQLLCPKCKKEHNRLLSE